MAVIQVVAQAPGVIFSAPSPVTDHVAPAPAITFATQAPVIEYVVSTPSDFYAAPARVIDHVAPAPVIEHNAPPSAVTCFAPCEQLPPDTMVTVITDVSSDTPGFVNPQFSTTAVAATASQVIGSLPLLVKFAAPVYNQIRQEQIVAEETTQKLVDIQTVHEQRTVQRLAEILQNLDTMSEVFLH